MIKGKFLIEIEVPIEGDNRPTIQVKGEYNVNSREELLDYLDQGLSALEGEGRKRVAEAEGKKLDDGTD